MARFTDSVCKLCRREGRKLFLKGTRCESDKCSLKKRNYAPGMHGQRRGKLSEYGTRLREKQKLRRFYGVMQRQFDRYFECWLHGHYYAVKSHQCSVCDS